MRVRSSASRAPLVAAMGLALAAVPRPGEAGQAVKPVRASEVSLVPLFDTNERFRPKKTFNLRFRAKKTGAPVAIADISFTLRHGPGDKGIQLPARELQGGVFEVPFTPAGPGQYAVVASIRGAPEASIPPVRLGVLGAADGFIEEPPEADPNMRRKARKLGKRR